MPARVRDRLVPAAQRRTPAELTAELELRAGDGTSKVSAFWTMLTLSAVIAAAGVPADSTATVIGAMVVAPLSTPIMGVALGVVKRTPTGAGRYVLGGTAAVVAVGLRASLAVPRSYDLLSNTQISGRTSLGPADLLAAMATGLAGAVALARRDVAAVLPAVLPGVAVAVSLVPPLVVADGADPRVHRGGGGCPRDGRGEDRRERSAQHGGHPRRQAFRSGRGVRFLQDGHRVRGYVALHGRISEPHLPTW